MRLLDTITMPSDHGDTNPMTDIHEYFDLSYANYLVLPRTLLQSMPDTWQHAFVTLLEQHDAAFAHTERAEGYHVQTGAWHYPGDLSETALTVLGYTNDDETAVWYDPDGNEIDSARASVFVPCDDPVPHYERGRARVAFNPDALVVPNDAEPGVWVVWCHGDYGPELDSIHATELAALRRANDESYLAATFITFGSNVHEVLR
ncbi:hypothetical protein [Phytoactinopolyspora limicola]|uniref:hypothetical protein n=1 Tax=Phytoactinopolyspora limicola TaxID=2715536 RepID=UPI00140B5605|nr:hypothetical protein [Phytoactinopolyspora limicola]